MIWLLQTIWLAPRNVEILLLKGYRKVISPLYGDVCRYYPSCSSFALGQVQQRGVVLGSLLGIWRILRCNPWAQGGVDEVKPGSGKFLVTGAGFVVPKPKKG
jgi:putative membrane protein insertion efficiency factor